MHGMRQRCDEKRQINIVACGACFPSVHAEPEYAVALLHLGGDDTCAMATFRKAGASLRRHISCRMEGERSQGELRVQWRGLQLER